MQLFVLEGASSMLEQASSPSASRRALGLDAASRDSSRRRLDKGASTATLGLRVREVREVLLCPLEAFVKFYSEPVLQMPLPLFLKKSPEPPEKPSSRRRRDIQGDGGGCLGVPSKLFDKSYSKRHKPFARI